MRKKLPVNLERKVLVKNRHCCCICQRDGFGQEVIVHHIDGDNSNNTTSNLAVLCLIHASMADAALRKGKLGAGKKLKPEEIKEYKKIWERKIELESKQRRQFLPVYKRKQLEIMYHFEINRIKNELLSFKDTDKRIKEKFDFFDYLVIEELTSGVKIRNILLKAYSDLGLFTIGETQLPKRLASSIWGLFIHLVGPDKVKMDQDDKKLFTESLKVLSNLGEFSAEFSNNKSVLKKICNVIYDFYEIGIWYKLKKEKNKIYKALLKIKESCLKFEENKRIPKYIKERRVRRAIVDNILKQIK